MMKALKNSNTQPHTGIYTFFKSDSLRTKCLMKELKTSQREYARLHREFNNSRMQAQNLIKDLMHRQEEERKAISRELHDEIAQLLTGINFKLEGLRLEAANSRKCISTKIKDTQVLVEKSVGVIHDFARNLRPQSLDDVGLCCALKGHIKYFVRNTNIRVNFTPIAQLDQLDMERKNTIYRVVQETTANIAKHSKATQATISFSITRNILVMKIHNNGISFDVKKMMSSRANNRLGLIGMQERIHNVQGKLMITSSPAKGTMVKVTLPYNVSKSAL